MRQRQGRVILVPDRINGYFVGMNSYAAKDLHIPFHHNKTDIVVVKGVGEPGFELDDTIRHERLESGYMKKGMPYREAHAKTLIVMGEALTKKEALIDSDKSIARAGRGRQ